MLHEILLSLAGNPSPLLRADPSGANAGTSATKTTSLTGGPNNAAFSPPEQELLASVAHLSSLHVKLLGYTAQISSSHSSTICRAVAASIASVHLAAFQRKVLEVEDQVLRHDAALVGAYNIVPLTAVVGEFSDWTRRMEWLWAIVDLMLDSEQSATTTGGGRGSQCTGARIIDKLRDEMQTGYVDIETTAASLVAVAETAWLKQVSAWILYGRLPTFGAEDFFVQRSAEGEEDFVCKRELLPSFVTSSTAASMFFIGSSLSYVRGKSTDASSIGLHGAHHLSSQLSELSQLTLPLDSAVLARTVTKIRLFLSKNILQKLLPLAKVVDFLQLMRDFFLLGRGEFAMALTQQADEKVSSRWRRADNLAHEKRDGLGGVVVKEGEVVAVLARTWGALGSLQGQHSEEDEGLERARGLIRLSLAKSKSSVSSESVVAATPFRNLLFGVPVVLTLQIPSPLDLFLSPADLQTYTAINSYLMSIRRAHIRLTDLWKISSLRRHYPPPPRPPYGTTARGRARVQQLRRRHAERSNAMRSAWATSSAAIFFLGECEAYLQTEVVAGQWDGFHHWLLTGNNDSHQQESHSMQQKQGKIPEDDVDDDCEAEDEGDIWLITTTEKKQSPPASPNPAHDNKNQQERHPHDPQTLATAHRLYLRTLSRRLLLTQQSFTLALYEFLVDVDHLIGKVHRLHDIWTAVDLEEDAGVVDAFVDLEREELDVRAEIKGVERRVKAGVERCLVELRGLEARLDNVPIGAELPLDDDGNGEVGDDAGLDPVGVETDGITIQEQGAYVPRRVGGLDRLLMKLDFGSWFESGRMDDFGMDDDPS